MNNARRNKVDRCIILLNLLDHSVDEVIQKLESIRALKTGLDKWSKDTKSTIERIEAVLTEESDALESMPENLQTSNIAWGIEWAIDDLNGALEESSKILEAIDNVEDTYIKSFLGTFNPEKLIESLKSIQSAIEPVKDSLEGAKRK